MWSGRPDASASWLRSVIDGRVSVPLAHGDPARSRQPAACRGRASRQLGGSVHSASCASPHSQSSATPFRGFSVPPGYALSSVRGLTLTAGIGRQLAWSDAHRRSAHACAAMVAAAGLLIGPAASRDGVTECCDELNTYAQVRLVLYLNRPQRLPDRPTPEPPLCTETPSSISLVGGAPNRIFCHSLFLANSRRSLAAWNCIAWSRAL